jgi:hypothetical protein
MRCAVGVNLDDVPSWVTVVVVSLEILREFKPNTFEVGRFLLGSFYTPGAVPSWATRTLHDSVGIFLRMFVAGGANAELRPDHHFQLWRGGGADTVWRFERGLAFPALGERGQHLRALVVSFNELALA